MRGPRVKVLLAVLLAGCSVSREPAGFAPAELPPRAPRWVAVQLPDGLYAVRFDDPSRPAVTLLASSERGETVDLSSIVWSPTGEHIAFVTNAGEEQRLWVASAASDFERAELELPPVGTLERERAWNVRGGRALAFIGAETLALATPTGGLTAEERVAFHRIALGSGELESIGELSCTRSSAVFVPSEYGLLFGTGACGSADLMVANELDPPHRLGSALGADSATRAELTWAADGQSATWWTQPSAPSVPGSGSIGSYAVPDPPPPDVEIESEAQPRIGQVQIPLGFTVDQHPHGTLTFQYDLIARAGAPEGPMVAHAVAYESGGVGMLLLDDPLERNRRERVASAIMSPTLPTFGFLDRSTPYFAVQTEPTAGSDTSSFEVTVGEAGMRRQTRALEGFALRLDGFAGTDRLVFVRAASALDLWTLDARDPDATLTPVELEGFVAPATLLKQGQRPGPFGGLTTAALADGQAVLVGTTRDRNCALVVSGSCAYERWLIDLEAEPRVHRFDERWSEASTVLWAVDGEGILAIAESGLFFVPDPTAPSGFELVEAPSYVFAPDRWPQNDS